MAAPPAQPELPSFEALLLRDFLLKEEVLDRFHERLRPMPPVTGGLLAGCFAWQLLPALAGVPLWASRDEATLVALGARVHDEVVAGALWRLVAPLFLHASGLHLLLNALALWLLGRICEALYGPGRLLALFLLSGLGGSLLSQLVGGPISVGASGAVFGLLGAASVFGLRRAAVLHEELQPLLGRALLPWVALNLLLGLILPGIDNAGHLGGLLAGGLLGLVLQDRVLGEDRQRAGTGLLLGGLSVVLLVAVTVAMLRSAAAIGP